MGRAKRARSAETPKQPSLCLMLRALHFYPDRWSNSKAGVDWSSGSAAGSCSASVASHLGEPTAPPPIAPARGPPLWDLTDAGASACDPHAQPAPEYAFDQRIAW